MSAVGFGQIDLRALRDPAANRVELSFAWDDA